MSKEAVSADERVDEIHQRLLAVVEKIRKGARYTPAERVMK